MKGVHPVANEAALRALCDEIARLHLIIAQLVGNQALERHLAEQQQALAEPDE